MAGVALATESPISGELSVEMGSVETVFSSSPRLGCLN